MNQDNDPASPETIQARFDQAWEPVARLADQHTRLVQSWLPTRTPQAKRFQGLGVSAGSSGLPVPLLNLALGARYPAGTGQGIIDAEIQRVKGFFAQRGVPWYWWLGPFAQPADVAQHLEQNDLVFDRPALPAMVAPLPASVPPINPDVQVWQAANQADLQAASTIRRIAFRFPDGVASDYFEAMADDWLRGDPARLYLARLADGPPAAIGALIVGAGIPGVYVMATLPAWRRRGLGKGILAHILTQAAADGHRLIALTAGKMGYPLYRQFGFEHLFSYAIYRPT